MIVEEKCFGHTFVISAKRVVNCLIALFGIYHIALCVANLVLTVLLVRHPYIA